MDLKPFSESINEESLPEKMTESSNITSENTGLTPFSEDIYGGPGSGHHDHEGRPGKTGGSQPGVGGAGVDAKASLGRAGDGEVPHDLGPGDFIHGPGVTPPSKKAADGTVSKKEIQNRHKALEGLWYSAWDYGAMQLDEGEALPQEDYGLSISAYNKLRAGIETADPLKDLTKEERKEIEGWLGASGRKEWGPGASEESKPGEEVEPTAGKGKLGIATGEGTEHHLGMDDLFFGPGITKPVKKEADGTIPQDQLAKRKKDLESVQEVIEDYQRQLDKGEAVPEELGRMIDGYNKLQVGIGTANPVKDLSEAEKRAINIEMLDFFKPEATARSKK